MRRRRSLSFRLLVYLFVVQLALILMMPIFVIIAAVSGLNPVASQNLNEWGEGRARDLVLGSLKRSSDNTLRIEQNVAVRDYLKSSPSFLCAAWDATTGAVAEGSSKLLLELVRPKWSADVTSIRFKLPKARDDSLVGVLRQSQTPVGQLVIVIYGYSFQFRDLLYQVSMMFSPFGLALFSPLILPATFLAFFVVRHGLAPLRVAARKVGRIDVNSPNLPIPDDDVPDEVVPFVTAVNDAMRRVNQSVAAQRRFLANAAHELRTPITILCSHIDNPNERTFIKDLKRDAKRIRTVVEQLLSAAQISHNKDALSEVADLCSIVLTTVLDYMPLAVANDQNIELDRPKAPVLVRCDRYALERVVVNLIENACHAEPKGGTVFVRVFADAVVEVEDHGPGIAPDDREKIFEPFWRKSNSIPGTGLGLAITREIIECHNGAISIHETPGGGTTMRVVIPRHPEVGG